MTGAPAVPSDEDLLEATARDPEAFGLFYRVGWATGDIKRVELRYRAGGSAQRRPVALIDVSTVPLVVRAGEQRPFKVLAFRPPPDMRAAKLYAFAANGKRLGHTPVPRIGRDYGIRSSATR